MPPITLTVAVRIMNDGVFEITERFQAMLRLLDSSLPRIVIRPAEATIVIVDDDSKLLYFAPTHSHSRMHALSQDFSSL